MPVGSSWKEPHKVESTVWESDCQKVWITQVTTKSLYTLISIDTCPLISMFPCADLFCIMDQFPSYLGSTFTLLPRIQLHLIHSEIISDCLCLSHQISFSVMPYPLVCTDINSPYLQDQNSPIYCIFYQIVVYLCKKGFQSIIYPLSSPPIISHFHSGFHTYPW